LEEVKDLLQQAARSKTDSPALEPLLRGRMSRDPSVEIPIRCA